MEQREMSEKIDAYTSAPVPSEGATPGPWRVNTAGIGSANGFVLNEVKDNAPGCGVDDVAVAADIVDPLTSKPSEANARLIAAAPDLFAALNDLAGWMDMAEDMPADKAELYEADLNRARAAITAATGSEQ
jgi:hypothetical protein